MSFLMSIAQSHADLVYWQSFDQIGDVAPRVRSLCQLFQVVKAGVVCGPRLDFVYTMVEDAPGLNTFMAKIYLHSGTSSGTY